MSGYLTKAGLLSATLFVAFSASAFSKNIDLQAKFSEKAVFDTNPTMLSQGEKDLYGSTTTASLSAIKKMQTRKIGATFSGTRNQFNLNEFNSSDFRGLVNISWNSSRWQASLESSLNYDTTRTSEITTFGKNIGAVRRTSYLLTPKISYMTSLRSKIEISGSISETRYASSSLKDFRTLSLTPSFIYNISQTQQAIFSIQAQRYQSLEDQIFYIDSAGPSIGWSSSITPRLTTQLSIGLMGSKTHGDGILSQKIVWNDIFSASLLYSNQKNRLNISATRVRQPFSNGSESVLTSLSAQDIYSFNERLSLDVNGKYQFTKQPNNAAGNLDTILSGETKLIYKKSKLWDITTSYKYRKQTLTGSSNEAEQNIFRVGLSYKSMSGR